MKKCSEVKRKNYPGGETLASFETFAAETIADFSPRFALRNIENSKKIHFWPRESLFSDAALAINDPGKVRDLASLRGTQKCGTPLSPLFYLLGELEPT